MTITRRQLDSEYAEWFRGMRYTEEAKREILKLFGTEPDEDHRWTGQDIYEQSKKIIERWNRHDSDRD